ncbi:MAG: DUF4230 domain-containing protein [Rhodobacteraceae bacterium]|nr:DUF4230 domain-containing protein [Paracoccaceae bacterium]
MPLKRIVSVLLLMAATAAGTAVAVAWNGPRAEPLPGATTLLRSEMVKNLVTNRITLQVVAHEAVSTRLGRDEIVAYGTVTLHVGMDLENLGVEETTSDTGEPKLVLTVPQVQIVSVELNERSVYILRKSSLALTLLSDLDDARVQSLIRELLRVKAQQFARNNGLLPTRQHLQERLTELLVLFGYDPAQIEFAAETT